MEEEGDETAVSETWPFVLRRLGEIGDKVIFEFEDDDEPYFAIGEPYLDFLPKKRYDFSRSHVAVRCQASPCGTTVVTDAHWSVKASDNSLRFVWILNSPRY